MFETLFKYPRVITRHRTGASVEALELLLNHFGRGEARLRQPSLGWRNLNAPSNHRLPTQTCLYPRFTLGPRSRIGRMLKET